MSSLWDNGGSEVRRRGEKCGDGVNGRTTIAGHRLGAVACAENAANPYVR